MAFFAACLAASMMLALFAFFSLFLDHRSPLARDVIRSLAMMGPYPERTELFVEARPVATDQPSADESAVESAVESIDTPANDSANQSADTPEAGRLAA